MILKETIYMYNPERDGVKYIIYSRPSVLHNMQIYIFQESMLSKKSPVLAFSFALAKSLEGLVTGAIKSSLSTKNYMYSSIGIKYMGIEFHCHYIIFVVIAIGGFCICSYVGFISL